MCFACFLSYHPPFRCVRIIFCHCSFLLCCCYYYCCCAFSSASLKLQAISTSNHSLCKLHVSNKHFVVPFVVLIILCLCAGSCSFVSKSSAAGNRADRSSVFHSMPLLFFLLVYGFFSLWTPLAARRGVNVSAASRVIKQSLWNLPTASSSSSALSPSSPGLADSGLARGEVKDQVSRDDEREPALSTASSSSFSNALSSAAATRDSVERRAPRPSKKRKRPPSEPHSPTLDHDLDPDDSRSPSSRPFLSVVGELHAVIPPILPQTQKTKICDISNNAAYFSFRFQFLSLLFCSSSPCPFSCVLLFTSSFSVPLPWRCLCIVCSPSSSCFAAPSAFLLPGCGRWRKGGDSCHAGCNY